MPAGYTVHKLKLVKVGSLGKAHPKITTSMLTTPGKKGSKSKKAKRAAQAEKAAKKK